ncbi:amidohydrolase family protein [Chitinophaga japonensis]|uniref:Putative TIM-barrel fold metal-dependent hydrolase n=1 Tax=Chitinophaga japonensis TaxID=104662 RepID=A0A562T356_CHIJA|nr:amidohydrolase family protein [Chitinophaga japonensis]TWI87972.1 putative TIM-barrel fold metal-dependent hydrolase [Chitinophaga japonensis]
MIFDAHFHIIDPRFPLVPNQGYLPPAFTVADYLSRVQSLNVKGGAVVSGSFQAFDQQYLVDALRALGPGFAGVTQVPADIPDKDIRELDAAGVRAVRFNVQRGGSEGVQHLERLARRVYDLAGWHTELYIDSRALKHLLPQLKNLPAMSIDHLGLSKEGLPYLLELVAHGARVKATGFSRCDFDVAEVMKAIVAINPAALMFGTDLPSTRAPQPFRDEDAALVKEHFPEDTASRILYRNAKAFYA